MLFPHSANTERPKHSNMHLTELQLPRVFDRKRVERTGRIVAPIKETNFVGGGGDRENEALCARKGIPNLSTHTSREIYVNVRCMAQSRFDRDKYLKKSGQTI